MDPYQLVVGDKECPYKAVVPVIRQSAAIRNEWSTFARQLDVSSEQIDSFRQDLLLKTMTYTDLIWKVLEIWRAENAGKATLANLLNVVEGHCGANDVGELLRLEYKLPCRGADDNSITWKDLSPAFQKKVMETFHDFTPNLKFTDVLPKLNRAALVSLMRGKKPHVLSLPEELSYYVSRTVVTRNIISAQIFDQNSSDRFLFTGMDRYELSKLAKDKLTSSSRQQLQNGVFVKFMILDQSNHFERICGKTNHPVHSLRREGDGKLRWMKSKGEMDTLREYVDQRQDELDEEQFFQICISRSLPVLICDSPGMGKSVLLAQIGHILVQLLPESAILFIVLSKFIEYAKSIKTDDKLKVIELTLQNWTAVALQQSKLDSDKETVSIELLLDGYDEVDSADRKWALKILQIISKSYKSIRMWITSRPHLMEELENGFNVLGYNIRPFHEENQVYFLSSFWSRNEELDQEKVKLFAKQCLKSLKATMNSTDNDIAGIPLQCLLIGEVFEQDAVEYAKVDQEIGSCGSIEIEIGTITDLYHQLVQKKLEKYNSAFGKPILKDDDLMTIHAHLSLEELFPVEHGFLKLTKAADIDIEEVVKAGILISTRMGEVTFLHRTFAEYFTAWFIFNKLQQEEEWTPELLNLFFTIMSCSKIHRNETIFTHSVICYFLDSNLANIPLEMLPNNFPSKLNDNQLKLVEDIARSCIRGNFVQIFKLFYIHGTFDMIAANVFNLDLLLLSVHHSTVELVTLVLALYERHRSFNLEVQKTTLLEAVKQGKFPILEFLIKTKQLRGIVETFVKDTNLVYDCVARTWNSSDEDIKERILVLQTLVEINGSLVDGLNDSSRTTPLLAKGHVKLLIELVRHGANVVVQDYEHQTVLHLSCHASTSREDYHNLVMSIPTDNLKKIINFKTSINGDTALMSILRWLDPLPETLDIFNGVGSDFNHVNKVGDSVLAVAIKECRNAETILKLIQLGPEGKRPCGNTNLLKIAAIWGNKDAVGVLLDECKIDVNSTDNDGWTPLDHAIDNILTSDSLKRKKFSELGKKLIERGGGLKEFANFMRKPLIHVVAANNLESVKLLVQLGIYKVAECERSSLALEDRYSVIQHLLQNDFNPTALNNQNETPFHAFLRNKEGHDFKIFQLFKSKWDESSLWTPTIATLALGYAVRDDTFPDKDLQSFARECETHGADFNWREYPGYNSLLQFAAFNGKASTVKLLVMKDFFNANSKNKLGVSPLHQAASSKQNTCLETINCLLENGAKQTEISESGENILHFAATGTTGALKYLLELGKGDANGKDLKGDTPLHYAVSNRNKSAEIDGLEKCELLIQHGADVTIKNCSGHTPMDTAIVFQSENTPLIELLRPKNGGQKHF